MFNYSEENEKDRLGTHSEYLVRMEMLQVIPLLRVQRMKTQSRIILGGECGNDLASKILVFIHLRNSY